MEIHKNLPKSIKRWQSVSATASKERKSEMKMKCLDTGLNGLSDRGGTFKGGWSGWMLMLPMMMVMLLKWQSAHWSHLISRANGPLRLLPKVGQFVVFVVKSERSEHHRRAQWSPRYRAAAAVLFPYRPPPPPHRRRRRTKGNNFTDNQLQSADSCSIARVVR